jgi:hypothetical protein
MRNKAGHSGFLTREERIERREVLIRVDMAGSRNIPGKKGQGRTQRVLTRRMGQDAENMLTRWAGKDHEGQERTQISS